MTRNSEIELIVEPYADVLEAYDIAPEVFDAALTLALEELDRLVEQAGEHTENLPPLDALPILIKGETYRLGELAAFRFSGA